MVTVVGIGAIYIVCIGAIEVLLLNKMFAINSKNFTIQKSIIELFFFLVQGT